MKRKGLAGTIGCAVLALILAVVLAASYFTLKNYVVVDFKLFPRDQQVLDIRDKSISAKTYDTLLWRMPGTQILWSVPFQNSRYDCTTQELTVTQLEEADLETLAYFPQLKTVNAQSCTDYALLKALYERYPGLEVRYSVPIGGESYGPETTTVTLKTLNQEDIQRLAYLPNLKVVDGTGCREYSLLRALKQSSPQWEVRYLTSIAGTEIDPAATNLELTGAAYEELSVGFAAMPELQSVTIHAPKASGQELQQLRLDYPNVNIRWELEVFGKTYADDTTELDISHKAVGSVENAKQIASKFPSLTKLIVDSTGIDNEEMAAYREEVRSQYKVVWTVIFSEKCKARTDETWFMPIHQGEYYFEEKNAYNLRYCEDMECVDIGHSTVKTLDFVTFMPNLKYLILAWTAVQDITPLSTCKNLVFLELDHCVVRDYTPLQGCTALEDLNINDNDWPVSIDPLLTMTWLKNLWVPTRTYSEKMALIEALPNTRVVTSNTKTTFLGGDVRCTEGEGWRNLKNYYDMRDCLGMYYMN